MERSKVGQGRAARRLASLRVVLAALFVVVATAVGARGEETTAAKVDLNTASAAELESLPGVGPSKAQAILAHREVAPFKSTEELIEVKGIGDKLYAQLKDRVTVSAAGAAGGGAKKPGEPAAAAPADAKSGRTASAAAPR